MGKRRTCLEKRIAPCPQSRDLHLWAQPTYLRCLQGLGWRQEPQQQNPDFLHMALPKARMAKGESRGLFCRVSFPWREKWHRRRGNWASLSRTCCCAPRSCCSTISWTGNFVLVLNSFSLDLSHPSFDLSAFQPVRHPDTITRCLRWDGNVQDFFENLARGHLTGHFSVYFVQDKLINTCKWQ